MQDENEAVKTVVVHFSSLIAAAIVVFGATAHTAAQAQRARDAKKGYSWIDIFTSMIIAAFSGMMFGLVSAYLFTEPVAIYMSSGAGAFLGLQGVNALTNTVLDIVVKHKKQ